MQSRAVLSPSFRISWMISLSVASRIPSSAESWTSVSSSSSLSGALRLDARRGQPSPRSARSSAGEPARPGPSNGSSTPMTRAPIFASRYGSPERDHLRPQVAHNRDQPEDYHRRHPERAPAAAPRRPQREDAQHDQRHIHRRIRQQQGAQDAAGILQQAAQAVRQPRVLRAQPPQLQRLEGKESRLDGGKEGGGRREKEQR